MRGQKPDITQAPEISHHRTTQVAQQTGVRDQEVDDQDQEQRRRPRRNPDVADVKVWVRPIRLDRLVAQQQKHPYARPQCRAVQSEDVAFEESV